MHIKCTGCPKTCSRFRGGAEQKWRGWHLLPSAPDLLLSRSRSLIVWTSLLSDIYKISSFSWISELHKFNVVWRQNSLNHTTVTMSVIKLLNWRNATFNFGPYVRGRLPFFIWGGGGFKLEARNSIRPCISVHFNHWQLWLFAIHLEEHAWIGFGVTAPKRLTL